MFSGGKAGAVYIFTRLPIEEGVGRKCTLSREGALAGVWQGTERFKLQAHDAVAADRFGSAISYLVRVVAAKRRALMTWLSSGLAPPALATLHGFGNITRRVLIPRRFHAKDVSPPPRYSS